ncbi:siderophore ferric iron reductase [Marinomonas sp. 15G1-11]|uniref:Siderophore ferric iron reductase n=1 Tax=Marinomonas phaeophyticola TaxID=3004091 RepID=A0ABT4JTW9_9GAMM|nr:siderophore ferric iron reductase [Marinomonas sp. 15G1-11]MCZ2721851.1 siderophore ferric iron reductase [Marinomonas sp. 15G1-11]
MMKPLDQLFAGAQQFYEPLKGKEWQEEDAIDYFSCCSATKALRNLKQGLQQAHPEAGIPYWRIRAWELSWWQPVSLALMCVYHLKQVPDTLASIQQYQYHNYIAGYTLRDGTWLIGSLEARIQSAASQLALLFDPLVNSHTDEFKGKSTLYKALLADLMMGYLTTATQNIPKYNPKKIQEDYLKWSSPMALPLDPIDRLERQGHQIIFHRRTCCLTFRCQKNDLCNNCPKQKKSQPRHV